MSLNPENSQILKNNRVLSNWYLFKILYNFSVLFFVMIYFFIQVENTSILELFTIPVMLVFGSFVVWAFHKYPLHNRFSFFPYPYKKHTVEHHTLYTYHDLDIKHFKEIPYIMFGVLDVSGFALIFVPILYFLTSFLFNSNVVNLIIACSSGYFIIYEFMHTISHLPNDHKILKFRYFKFMWNHHRIHHHPRVMNKANFNIVFPIFDYLFGTLKTDLPVDYKIERIKKS